MNQVFIILQSREKEGGLETAFLVFTVEKIIDAYYML